MRHSRPLLKRLMRAHDKNHHAQTVTLFEKAAKITNPPWMFWRMYGDALYYMVRYEDAKVAARKAIRKAPPGKEYHGQTLLAEIYERQGKMNLAEKWYRKALTSRPKWQGRGWIFLGDFLAGQGRFREAEKCLRKATLLKKDVPDEAFENLGLLLRSHGKYKEAKKCLHRALKLDPKLRNARIALADLNGLT